MLKFFVRSGKFVPASRHFSVNRKALLPVIMKIHPDRFSQEDAIIQETNLKSMQSINELWDTIIVLKDKIDAGESNIQISPPFRVSYNFTCFIRPEVDSPESDVDSNESIKSNVTTVDLTPRKIEFTLTPPPNLCTNQTLILSHASGFLDSVYKSLGKFFSLVGEENPFGYDPDLDEESAGEQMERQRMRPRGESNSIPGVSLAQMDRDMAERYLRKARGLSIFSHMQPRNERMKKKLVEFHAAQVEIFLMRKRVFVRGLTVVEQIAAVERLRKFLIDFGEVINFSVTTWDNVVIVLCGPPVKKGPGYAAAGEVERVVPRYSSEILQGTFVLTVPHKFKSAPMLDLMRESLPAARYM